MAKQAKVLISNAKGYRQTTSSLHEMEETVIPSHIYTHITYHYGKDNESQWKSSDESSGTAVPNFHFVRSFVRFNSLHHSQSIDSEGMENFYSVVFCFASATEFQSSLSFNFIWSKVYILLLNSQSLLSMSFCFQRTKKMIFCFSYFRTD